MLHKRPNTRFWWCDFRAPNGQRIQRSTKTVDRMLAQEYEDKLRYEMWRVIQLGEKPRRKWKEAVVRWAKETTRKTLKDDLDQVRYLDKFIGDMYLDEINRTIVDRIAESKLNTGVKPATVNRLMEVMRVILNTAVKHWEWVDRVPHIRMLREPRKRIRWLTREEADRLIECLPIHLKATARFSLATGLRQANVTGLQWTEVDLDRRVAWVHPDQSKTGMPIGVPLNSEAVIVLREQMGRHKKFCFTYKRKPILKCNTKAWRNALVAANIENFRWHDLRHTWASWHIQNGTPMHVLQELGGWSDIRMVQRYAHLAPEHLSKYAETLCGLKPVPTLSTTVDNWKQKSSYL